MTGIALAQTAVTLQADNVTAPALANNVTNNMFGVTFTETGLPSGTSWNVTLSGVLLTSTVPTISFSEPNGTYAFTVASISVDKIFPSTGNVTVNGEIAFQAITFAPANQSTYNIKYTENGLPSGMQWGVTLNGSAETAVNPAINFVMVNGTYTYAVVAPTDYGASPLSGSVTVHAKNVSLSIVFVLVIYPVDFKESGLPSGTTWYINITSGMNSGPITSTSYTVSLTNGSYSYTIATSDKIYSPSPSSGSLLVKGASTAYV